MHARARDSGQVSDRKDAGPRGYGDGGTPAASLASRTCRRPQDTSPRLRHPKSLHSDVLLPIPGAVPLR